MNEKQKSRRSLVDFMRADPKNEAAARRTFFRRTNLGTRLVSRDELATLLVQHGISTYDIKKEM